MEEKVPDSFICALTGEVMTDPVIDPDGNTYEKSAILAWLQKSETSPITRKPLQAGDLVPNRALRDAIAQFREQRAAAAAGGAPSAAAGGDARPREEANVKMTVNAKSLEDGDSALVHVSVVAEAREERSPVDIVCAIDVSGSMSAEATVQDRSGRTESHGLSLLDIVCHAVKTIIHAMTPRDRLAIVAWSTSATVALGLTQMDDSGRALADASLARLVPDGTTNLWDGLSKSLEILSLAKPPPGRTGITNTAVFLLTDGIPNIEPPRGTLPMLKRFKETRGGLPGSISTFGFGYQLDSRLLINIAIEGGGLYGYIPDAGSVGTTFVNAAANLLSSIAKDVEVTIQPQNGAVFADPKPLGGPPCTLAAGAMKVRVGSIQHGQSRDVVVRMRSMPLAGAPYATVRTTCNAGGAAPCTLSAEGVARDGGLELDVQVARLSVVDMIHAALHVYVHAATKDISASQRIVAEFAEHLRRSPVISDPRVAALLEDVEGQITLSFSKEEWYKRWACHYLPALMNSHQMQICSNFKDPGLQLYGGRLFSQLRDAVDDIFIKLPAPTPHVAPAARPGYSPSSPSYSPTAAAAAPAPVDMTAYMDCSAGCFSGKCTVLLADGSSKLVQDVVKGDVLMAGTVPGTVACVVRTVCPKNSADLVKLGDLLITPWHPVSVTPGVWKFPAEIGHVRSVPCQSVFTFVLSAGHVAIVGGVQCVTLAHGAVGDVREHAYFGTQRVIDDLGSLPGWDAGLVDVGQATFVRDVETHHVSGILVGEC